MQEGQQEPEVQAAPGERLRLVAGLGNPGPRYARTRHNIGFMVLDELARRHEASFRKAGNVDRVTVTGVTLLKPLTFMNRSGSAIQAAVARGGVKPEGLLVVQDDLDLPFGRLRLRFGGSSGGQRGIQDTIDRIGRDFWRLKIGISRAPAGRDSATWVLSRFPPQERELLERVVQTAADAAQHALEFGPESAANEFNSVRLAL